MHRDIIININHLARRSGYVTEFRYIDVLNEGYEWQTWDSRLPFLDIWRELWEHFWKGRLQTNQVFVVLQLLGNCLVSLLGVIQKIDFD